MFGRNKLAFWLTLSGVALVVAVGASYLHLVARSPLAFDEMDFDDNGFVTLYELIYANAYATRQIADKERTCTEYYALQDGLRLKVVCNSDERSSSLTEP